MFSKQNQESISDSDIFSSGDEDLDGTHESAQSRDDHFAFCFNPQEQQKETARESPDNFVSSLLKTSDSRSPVLQDGCIFLDDWDEAVVGWKNFAPNARYVPRRKRRKNPEVSDKPRGNFVKPWNPVRESGESVDSVWKSNVEPVTYRYVPNNGQYRLHKFCKEEIEWYTVRRKHVERVSPSLKARYVQREIKRQLKKDFSKKSDGSVGSNDGKRAHSTSSSHYRNKSPSFAFSKSASDLYVENISTRLNELDREIKKDSQIRKSNEDPRPFPFNISKGKLHQKMKDNPPFPQRSSHQMQGAFIVTPVGPQDASLRPLEKITPQQRVKEDMINSATKEIEAVDEANGGGGDGGDVSEQIHTDNTAVEVAKFDLERLQIVPLAETSRTYIDKVVKSKQEGSFKKIGGGHFVSSITMNGDDLEDSDVKDMTPIHSSRTRPMKEPNLPEIAGRRLEVSLTNYRLL